MKPSGSKSFLSYYYPILLVLTSIFFGLGLISPADADGGILSYKAQCKETLDCDKSKFLKCKNTTNTPDGSLKYLCLCLRTTSWDGDLKECRVYVGNECSTEFANPEKPLCSMGTKCSPSKNDDNVVVYTCNKVFGDPGFISKRDDKLELPKKETSRGGGGSSEAGRKPISGRTITSNELSQSAKEKELAKRKASKPKPQGRSMSRAGEPGEGEADGTTTTSTTSTTSGPEPTPAPKGNETTAAPGSAKPHTLEDSAHQHQISMLSKLTVLIIVLGTFISY